MTALTHDETARINDTFATVEPLSPVGPEELDRLEEAGVPAVDIFYPRYADLSLEQLLVLSGIQ